MTIFSLIRLALTAVMSAALVWPARRFWRTGMRREASGLALMAAGIYLAQISEILPFFGMPREHWSYWPLFFVGMGGILFGTMLVVGGGRGRGENPERDAGTS